MDNATPGVPPPIPPPPPVGGIQFDKVAYGPEGQPGTGATCVGCKRPITDAYYEVNGQVACPDCKGMIQSQLLGGSKVGRMLKAFVFGAVAMVVSAVGYFFLCKVTGSEFAIATIAMGWLIGWAVHKGANGRGGWFYMAVAVLLTYLAIGMAIVAVAMYELEGSIDGGVHPLVLAVFVVAAPVQAAIQGPLLFLIYGFGLWQAASMNRRPRINVTGPYYTRGGAVQGGPGTLADSRVL